MVGPIDPQTGYALLDDKDVIQSGDQFMSIVSGDWLPIRAVSIGRSVFSFKRVMRRPAANILNYPGAIHPIAAVQQQSTPQGTPVQQYQDLKEGDVLQAGDEWRFVIRSPVNGFWRPVNGSIGKTLAKRDVLGCEYRRPLQTVYGAQHLSTGMVTSVVSAIPDPVQYRDLEPDEILRSGDACLARGNTYWETPHPRHIGYRIDTIYNWNSYKWRRPLTQWDPIENQGVRVWWCNQGTCRDRENDDGHACYWCGAPEPKPKEKEEEEVEF